MTKVNYIYKYYQEIKSGKVIVGKWVSALYEKIVDGIQKKEYKLDLQKANAAIDWIESHCFHTEGPLAPHAMKLELWEKAFISCIFGILDPKTKKRQFREVVLIIGRKNGKSLLAAAIAKYEFMVDGGYGAKIYTIAPKLEQADIIYNNIWQMIQLDPEWQALKEQIADSRDEHNKRTMDDSMLARHRQSDLCVPGTNCTVKKIAFSSRKSDGFNPSLCICDEIASWKGDQGLKQYEVMKSGMGARPEPILLSCTTAGFENDGIYDELMKRSTRFLLGESREKRLLPFLYIIDDTEKWNDIDELAKSNPNLGVSVTVDYMLEEIAIADGSLSKKTEFLTKYCNVKQNSSLAWLPTKTVDACCGEHLSLEDFRDSYALAGIDLSQTTDLTAGILLCQKGDDIYVFAKFWLPSAKIDLATERDGVPYGIYIQRGLLDPSGDNFVDYHDCENWLKGLVEQLQIYPLMVGYDRYSAQYLVQDLNQYGFKTDDVYQGDNLWGVLQEMEGMMADGHVHIGDNDLLKQHLLNAAIKMDVQRGRGRLVKLSATSHIDGVAAMADAFCVRQKWWSQYGEQLRNA